MGSLTPFASVLQFGRGLVGAVLGLPYNVYRLDAGVIGSVISGDPDITGFQAKLNRSQSREVEAAIFELIAFEARCDNTLLRLGDILVGTDDRDLGTYVYAQYRQTDGSIWIDCEKRASIFRPRDGATAIAGAPAATPGAPFISTTFNSSDVSTRDVLTLAGGIYSFVADVPQFAAIVPFAIQVTARAGGPRADSIPSSTPSARYVGYVPPLGLELVQNDVLYIDEDHQYEVTSAFEGTQGFVGTMLVLEQAGQ